MIAYHRVKTHRVTNNICPGYIAENGRQLDKPCHSWTFPSGCGAITASSNVRWRSESYDEDELERGPRESLQVIL